MSSAFDVKIRLMEDTIPSGRYCKTARGRMGKCRELTEFRRTALQLYRHADTDTHRQRADDLIAEIDRRRAELAQGGNFARQIAEEDARRPAENGWKLFARLLRLASRSPADDPIHGLVDRVMTSLQLSIAATGGSEPGNDTHSDNSQTSGRESCSER